MKARNRKATAVLAVVLAAAIGFTGCSVKNKAAATVNGDDIPYEVANFYARYNQANFESYYMQQGGTDMWSQEVEKGKTYEDMVKENVIDSLKQMYILEDHMKDYKIELTDDEKKDIKKAAKKFIKDNKKDTLEFMTATEDVVERVMTLLTVQQKMTTAIQAKVDTKVTDKEAAQKKMTYVKYAFTTTDEEGNSKEATDDEKKELKKKAEELQKKVKDGGDIEKLAKADGQTASPMTFDKDNTAINADMIKAADKLKKGEVTDVISADDGYYVAKLTSTFDKQATEEKKTIIVDERKQKLFDDTYKKWEKKAKFELHKSVWKKITFKDGVTMKQEEQTDEGSAKTPTDKK